MSLPLSTSLWAGNFLTGEHDKLISISLSYHLQLKSYLLGQTSPPQSLSDSLFSCVFSMIQIIVLCSMLVPLSVVSFPIPNIFTSTNASLQTAVRASWLATFCEHFYKCQAHNVNTYELLENFCIFQMILCVCVVFV